MKTVKAKIKGTNAILEGCVCDDSFFVSVDHDTFERYDLDEVELCESNPNSLTLEEAAKEFSFISEGVDLKGVAYKDYDLGKLDGFKAGAEWQEKQDLRWAGEIHKNGYNLCKEQMLKDAVEGKIYGYGDGSYELVVSWLDLPKGGIYKDGDKVRIVVLKAEEEGE